ncbi:hypothetical protein ASE92_17290 [Pedobacter sp. Leaf41]|nr:hypothetical protein ASE92_17290 [Pedobacter sp. Leaf41]
MAFYSKQPNNELASCKNRKILTVTTNKTCPMCNKKGETGRWFSRKTGFKILNSSMISKDSKIPCPKCDFKSLEAIPIVLID